MNWKIADKETDLRCEACGTELKDQENVEIHEQEQVRRLLLKHYE
jgi:hypothetical protein